MGIIQKEIEQGLSTAFEIMSGSRPWSDLFIKHTFFTKDYKYYMSVISASKTEDQHKLWSGWVESRLRLLVQKLERAPAIIHARPYVKSFERRHRCTNDEQLRLVQDGSLQYLAPKDTKATEAEDSTKSRDEPNAEKVEGDAAAATQNGGGADPQSEVNGKPAEPTVTEVFTTTQYIGLELDPGACKSILDFRATPSSKLADRDTTVTLLTS